MNALRLEPNLGNADDVYEQLIAMHDGLSVEDSLRLNARLILLLANHIGDAAILAQAIALARRDRPEKDPG